MDHFDDNYDDSNRAFVQAFLAQNVLTFDTAKPILAAIFSVSENRPFAAEDVSIDDFTSYISAANSALSPLDYEIRSTFHQITRERIFALVNSTSDPMTQLATTYTAEEIAYIKRILDGMFDGANNKGRREAMCLSSMDAIQLAKGTNRRESQRRDTQGNTQGLTMREGEDVMEKLVNAKWLEKSQKNFYSLGPRALMELKGWLVDTYNEPTEDEEESAGDKIKFCHACKEIITTGQRCANQDCPCRLHEICTQNYFRIQRSSQCPLCHTGWDGNNFVGEKAITTSEAYLNGKRRGKNRPLANISGDGDEDEDA